MKTTCRVCAAVIEGDLSVLANHVQRCGKRKRPDLAAQVLERAQRIRPGLQPPMPTLPAVFFLKTAIPSQNKAHSQHWTTYNKQRTEWRTLIGVQLRSLLDADFIWSEWHFLRLIPANGKYYDHANLVGGGKPVVDALVHHHVVRDDAPKFFRAEYEQELYSDWARNSSAGLSGIKTIITLREARYASDSPSVV